MNELQERFAAVTEARSWLGTPYHSCADVKGAGVDCGMILVRIFVDCGLSPAIDPRPYSPDWHLHRAAERYLGFVQLFAKEIARDQAGPGDIVVFKYGRCYAHGAIVTEAKPYLKVLHAYSIAGRVIEEPLHGNRALLDPKRAPRFFSHWAIS